MIPTTTLRLAAGLTLAGALVPAGMAIAHRDGGTGLTGPQRTVIRDATRQFRDVDAAIAAGYLPTEECAALPDGSAGMGYHYVNPTLAADAFIDPTMPEILVYVEDEQGSLELGAVEYFAADADQDLSTADDRPTLMGHPFDGPMAGHEPGMPVHYDLHVWLYERNPAGELSAWNPDVSCD
ncbi:MAG TPA: hypothetical protein VK917_04420 [Ilumatobacter sp.]|jgi:hypothetical protein|nr:hypothetical protein [Ilumatobacter sp.]